MRRAHLVDQRFAFVGADTKAFRALASVALQCGETLDLDLTPKGIADDLAPRLAQALGKSIGLLREIVRNGHREKTTHMKTSYRIR